MSTARNVLASGKVYGDSLPYSLRHISPADALEDARGITHFLSHVVCAFTVHKTQVSEEAQKGMILVLDLLIDKIDIGSGKYKFPTVGWNDDGPALVERGGGAE